MYFTLTRLLFLNIVVARMEVRVNQPVTLSGDRDIVLLLFAEVVFETLNNFRVETLKITRCLMELTQVLSDGHHAFSVFEVHKFHLLPWHKSSDQQDKELLSDDTWVCVSSKGDSLAYKVHELHELLLWLVLRLNFGELAHLDDVLVCDLENCVVVIFDRDDLRVY